SAPSATTEQFGSGLGGGRGPGYRGLRERQGLQDELAEFPELDLTLMAGSLNGVGVHGHVLWAGDDEVVKLSERGCLVDALLARPPGARRALLFHPDPAATGTAAERVVPVAAHLDEFHANRLEHAPGRVVDAVVAPQHAWVVIGHPVAKPPHRHK